MHPASSLSSHLGLAAQWGTWPGPTWGRGQGTAEGLGWEGQSDWG